MGVTLATGSPSQMLQPQGRWNSIPCSRGRMRVWAPTRWPTIWDFSGSEAEFKKALKLDPSDATAHQWFSEALARMGGRAEESIDEANRAYQLDPLSPIIGCNLAQVYFFDRQFDKASEIAKKVIADNPTFSEAHHYLANFYWVEHKYPQAIQEFKSSAQLSGDENFVAFARAMDAGFRSGGWPSALNSGLEVLLALRKNKKGYVSPRDIALFYANLGDSDQAFEWLNIACEEHDVFLPDLRINPQFDSLRSDPRYPDLLRKIGFLQ
jgi:tetratricopeptide (TPR) repeat protein